MGTVLSLSPSYRKATLFEDGAATVGHYTAVQNSKNAKDKNLKRHSIISVLPWTASTLVPALHPYPGWVVSGEKLSGHTLR